MQSGGSHFCNWVAPLSCNFPLRNKLTLYTNLHNFYEVLSQQRKLADAKTTNDLTKLLSKFPLFFGMVNANQSPVFDPTTDKAHLKLFNSDPSLYDGAKSSMINGVGRLSDLVEISIEIDTGTTPLKLAKDKPKIGDTLYIIGFPMQTKNRFFLGGGSDSDGQSQYISIGKVISTKVWAEKSGNQISPIFENLYDKYMLFGDFDCEHGNSGGPIVNSKGEVVAIIAGLWVDKSQQPNTRLCGGLKFFDKQELQPLWDTLKVLFHP